MALVVPDRSIDATSRIHFSRKTGRQRRPAFVTAVLGMCGSCRGVGVASDRRQPNELLAEWRILPAGSWRLFGVYTWTWFDILKTQSRRIGAH
jgi:hypothetical protein